jgi:3-oxoacyl-[acyl-carrier protein] reductase
MEKAMAEESKVALVTGASRGIGKAIAASLAAEGIHVALAARGASALEAAQGTILRNGGKATIYEIDLLRPGAAGELAKKVEDDFGAVDVLVSNASSWHTDDRMYYGPRYWETSPEEIGEVLQVGLLSAMELARFLLPRMVERRSGRLLFISGGFSGVKDAVGWVHCYVQKKAIEIFVEGLAEELRPYEIPVNCVSPWYVATEPARQFLSETIDTALAPDDVADFAKFLLGPGARHVTGQTFLVRNMRDHGEEE